MGIEPTGRAVDARPDDFEDRGHHQVCRHFQLCFDSFSAAKTIVTRIARQSKAAQIPLLSDYWRFPTVAGEWFHQLASYAARIGTAALSN